MTIFKYGMQSRLPFPQIALRLASTDSSRFYSGLLAKVDTGADRTIVPQKLLDALKLNSAGSLEFEGAHGSVFALNIYFAELVIDGFEPLKLVVAGSENEDLILLGRDVINSYRILLDGPNRRLEISFP